MSEENKEMEKQVQDAVVDTSASEGREEDRDGRAKGKTYFRKKVCRFCANTVSYTHLTLPTKA